jgi:hypothetical protein
MPKPSRVRINRPAGVSSKNVRTIKSRYGAHLWCKIRTFAYTALPLDSRGRRGSDLCVRRVLAPRTRFARRLSWSRNLKPKPGCRMPPIGASGGIGTQPARSFVHDRARIAVATPGAACTTLAAWTRRQSGRPLSSPCDVHPASAFRRGGSGGRGWYGFSAYTTAHTVRPLQKRVLISGGNAGCRVEYLRGGRGDRRVLYELSWS